MVVVVVVVVVVDWWLITTGYITIVMVKFSQLQNENLLKQSSHTCVTFQH